MIGVSEVGGAAATLPWWSLVLIAYVCGSVPFGLLLGRIKGVDIRAHGSRNIGATNVGRVLGVRFGLLCFALDAAKGAAPVALAGILRGTWGVEPIGLETSDLWWWLAVAVATLVGHMASPWLGFRGGKGVATGFGALLAVWTPLTIAALIAFVVWLLFVGIARYVSLASIAAAASLPMAAAVVATWGAESPSRALASATPTLVLTSALALVVIVKHRSNIARLWRGEEPRIGRRDSAAVEPSGPKSEG